jgi:hypothetical protein
MNGLGALLDGAKLTHLLVGRHEPQGEDRPEAQQ